MIALLGAPGSTGENRSGDLREPAAVAHGVGVALVTGSAGLIGSEAVRHFAALGMHVIGIDNDMRRYFFGPDGSTVWSRHQLITSLGSSYTHFNVDIRDRDALGRIFRRYGTEVELIIHAAAQPSHDWAVREPFTDFDVNAVGTLNILEHARLHCAGAVFIHCSTNKVYGDTPNRLPFVELETRYEIEAGHPLANGIDESMSIDASTHSLFGVAKLAADVMVQEYGRYFGMRTACFRGGTLTGPGHSAAEMHGFLAYLVRCVMEGRVYQLYGYKGKMVRDVIHCRDALTAFEAFYRAPRVGEVYNLGGGRFSNISHLEAFSLAERITGKPAKVSYRERSRTGDHRWYISDMSKFRNHYPSWAPTYDTAAIMKEIFEANVDRWMS
jgi:CDP-paratose 2-epimerase